MAAAPLRRRAQDATAISVSMKNHRFLPAELHAPANVPIVLRVKNLDPAPMEFESVSLRVEKVVTENSEGIIRLRLRPPGSYNFSTISPGNQRGSGGSLACGGRHIPIRVMKM